MTDELNKLARINPVVSEELEQAVAVDRSTLLEMLEADSEGGRRSGGRFRPRVVGSRLGSRPESDSEADRSLHRLGYAGALVAAAAALLVVVMMGADQPAAEPDLVDPADDAAPVVSVVIEESDDRQPPTTPLTATEPDDVDDEEPTDGTDSPPETSGSDQTGDVTGDGTGTESEPSPTTAAPPVTGQPIEGPFDRATDLLSLHFDHSNRDDGHSSAAALELVTWFGLEPHVVSGTAPADSDDYVQPYESLMTTIWQNRWFDAGTNRPDAVSRTVQRWLATVDGGGRVWVAEGGVVDFTAEVLREMARQRPELDTSTAVNVIQHNGRNETQSKPENLQLVKARTSYERIDDGNSDNDTADLNQADETFTSTALAGRHRDVWTAAFEYRPAAELDFSDTVEVLHILGVATDRVADPADFANRFMN